MKSSKQKPYPEVRIQQKPKRIPSFNSALTALRLKRIQDKAAERNRSINEKLAEQLKSLENSDLSVNLDDCFKPLSSTVACKEKMFINKGHL